MKNSIWISLFVFLLMGCNTQKGNYSTSFDSTNNYNDNKGVHLEPEFIVYNIDAKNTRLFFKLNTDNLLYTKNEKDAPFKAVVLVNYRIYEENNTHTFVDSATKKIVRISEDVNSEKLIGSLDFKLDTGKNYLLKLLVTDFNRKQELKTFITIYKKSLLNRQGYLVTDYQTGEPVFSDYFSESKKVIIHVKSKESNLYCRYYNREFPLPPPPQNITPINTFSYQADSLFQLAISDSGTVVFDVNPNGFVFFQPDTMVKEGLCLFKFQQNFPNVSSYASMIAPLRYITQKVEFQAINESVDPKKSIENFWMEIGGNEDRSAALIKLYYGRVAAANKNFSSFTEGWRTDRGLIYIIYGKPNVVYKNTISETWIYGEETNIMSITFIFNKVENPFSENDYYLTRNETFRASYYRAVDSWRQGHTYNN